MKAVGAILALLLLRTAAPARPAPDTVYRVEVSAAATPVVSGFRNPRVPGLGNEPSLGYGFFARGMWRPGRMLGVGLSTGYMSIAEDEIPAGEGAPEDLPRPTARLSAIPMQIAISMRKDRTEVGMGVGPLLLISNIDNGDGVTAQGRRIEFGITLFGSYDFRLGGSATLGPELRILYLGYRGILSIMPSLSVRIDALGY